MGYNARAAAARAVEGRERVGSDARHAAGFAALLEAQEEARLREQRLLREKYV